MTRRDEEERRTLIEAAVTAYRARDISGRVLSSPAWHDLAPIDREAAFDLQAESRMIESAIDGRGLSTTARAVLAQVGFELDA